MATLRRINFFRKYQWTFFLFLGSNFCKIAYPISSNNMQDGNGSSNSSSFLSCIQVKHMQLLCTVNEEEYVICQSAKTNLWYMSRRKEEALLMLSLPSKTSVLLLLGCCSPLITVTSAYHEHQTSTFSLLHRILNKYPSALTRLNIYQPHDSSLMYMTKEMMWRSQIYVS